MIDFTDMTYLKTGNQRQRKAYWQLSQLNIFEALQEFQPVLAGTIPIDIDLPNSDLDIICCCHDPKAFASLITELFSKERGFVIKTRTWDGLPSVIVTFQSEEFAIEIFGPNKPVEEQNAFRHLVIEHKILREMGAEFKEEIIRLKSNGMKTEPAFAYLLNIAGNPYQGLLNFQI